MDNHIRHNWAIEEVKEMYDIPLLELIAEASVIHKKHHSYSRIYLNTLLSYKTGGCPEDCVYCAQSSRYNTEHGKKSETLTINDAICQIEKALEIGSERICISAAWKKIPSDDELDNIIAIGQKAKEKGLKICCALGTVEQEKILKLKEAGFTAFNHNIDTSERYYPQITTTRTYQDRLDTLKLLQENDMPYCSGGIIGMGETKEDRLEMLITLANQPKHPYSVPLNILVPIPGTPLENVKVVSHWEMIKLIAIARILMPTSIICLAAGRQTMNTESQTLCFLAGANSVFLGEKLLTTKNSDYISDKKLFELLKMKTGE